MAFPASAVLGNPRWWNGYAFFLHHASPALFSVAIGRAYLTPLWLPRAMTISRIVLRLHTGLADANLRLGLYADNAGTPAGARLLEDSGNLDASASDASVVFTLPSNRRMPRGLSWLGLICDSAVSVRTYVAAGPDPGAAFPEVGSERIGGGFYDRAGGFGAFTDPCPAVTGSVDGNFWSFVRVESVDE